MTGFAAHSRQFRAADAQVLGVAHNDPSTQHRFRLHCVAKFPFLSDDGGVVARKYGVDTFLHFFSRTTFLVDDKGIVRAVVHGMPDDDQVLATLRSWQAPGQSGSGQSAAASASS